METKETRIITCKLCQAMKTAYLAGTFDGKNKRWEDQDGKAWNGKTCPDCHVFKTKNAMRKKRQTD